MKIITSHVFPTIPIRTSDWCAHYDGEEEAGNYGWGRTEAEAIADFIENCADDHNERLGIESPSSSPNPSKAETKQAGANSSRLRPAPIQEVI